MRCHEQQALHGKVQSRSSQAGHRAEPSGGRGGEQDRSVTAQPVTTRASGGNCSHYDQQRTAGRPLQPFDPVTERGCSASISGRRDRIAVPRTGKAPIACPVAVPLTLPPEPLQPALTRLLLVFGPRITEKLGSIHYGYALAIFNQVEYAPIIAFRLLREPLRICVHVNHRNRAAELQH